MSETAPAVKTKAPTTAEKQFAEFEALAGALAAADAEARIKGDDSKTARTERASIATDTLHAAIKAKLDGDTIRNVLLNNGVLKGTVSKITTVADAVAAGRIATTEFKSLYEAYTRISLENRVAKVNEKNKVLAKAGKALLPVPGIKAGQVAPPVIKEVEKVVMPAPKDALEVILKDIREAGDEDMILDRASFWVTELTTKITAITSKINDGDSEK